MKCQNRVVTLLWYFVISLLLFASVSGCKWAGSEFGVCGPFAVIIFGYFEILLLGYVAIGVNDWFDTWLGIPFHCFLFVKDLQALLVRICYIFFVVEVLEWFDFGVNVFVPFWQIIKLRIEMFMLFEILFGLRISQSDTKKVVKCICVLYILHNNTQIHNIFGIFCQ